MQAVVGRSSLAVVASAVLAVLTVTATLPTDINRQSPPATGWRSFRRGRVLPVILLAPPIGRMAAGEIIAQRYVPDFFGKVGRAVARLDEIANDGL